MSLAVDLKAVRKENPEFAHVAQLCQREFGRHPEWRIRMIVPLLGLFSVAISINTAMQRSAHLSASLFLQ